METKYETGKWLREGTTVFEIEDFIPCLGKPYQRNRFWFSVQGHSDTDKAELEKVATLAQAAPELLEALENLLAFCENKKDENGNVWNAVCKVAAKITISKAKGA